MTNIAAYKIGYRDATRLIGKGARLADLSHREVSLLHPRLSNFSEAYRNGWEDAKVGDTWRIDYLASRNL